MAPERSPLSPEARVFAALLPFVLAAACVLLFDVVRDIPVSYTCGDEAPAGHDEVVAAYRSGAMVLHLLTLGAALAALTLLSADRGRGRGPAGVGWPTLIAVVVLALATLQAVLPGDGRAPYVLLPLIFVVVGFVLIAEPFGDQATGALAALLLIGAAAWARWAVARGRTFAVRTALWALVVLTGAHLLLVYWQGDAPALC